MMLAAMRSFPIATSSTSRPPGSLPKSRWITFPDLFGLPAAAQPVEQDCDQDGAADESPLQKRVDAEKTEAVADDFDQRRADQRPKSRTDTAHKAGAANDRRRDDLELHARSEIGGDRA